MGFKYSEAIGKSFRFCIQPKRWLPVFAFFMIFFVAGLGLLLSAPGLLNLAELTMATNSAIVGVLGALAGLFVLFIIFMLVSIWVTGAIIHQSYKEKEWRQSWTVAKKRYLSLLVVTIIIAIITTGLNLIPIAGFILVIIASLAFFFAQIGVIVNKFGFEDALKDSWRIFRKKPWSVLVMFLVVAIISGIIMLIFMIPLMISLVGSLTTLVATEAVDEAAAMSAMMGGLFTNLWAFVISGIIFAVGMAISGVFGIKLQVEFYLQAKKQRLGLKSKLV